jgi:hypothetical protein
VEWRWEKGLRVAAAEKIISPNKKRKADVPR